MSKKMSTHFVHRYCKVETDLGSFWIASSHLGITAIRSGTESATAFETAYKKRTGIRPHEGTVSITYKQAIHKAFEGKQTSPECIDWTYFTKFQRQILKRLLKIQAGTVRTYSWLARKSGHPNASRAVGNVMAQNPIPFLLPCHRIVPMSGGIGNYGLGKELKRTLLEREGITS